MTEVLQQEIRTLEDIFESERDPEGRVFAPLADAFRRAGQIQQAVRLLNDGLARHPQFVPGHVVAAQLYVEQGLAEEAAIAARNALELDGENVNALRSLLRVLEEKGDAETEDVRARLVSLAPDYAADGGEVTTRPPRVEAVPAAPVAEVELDGPAVDTDAETVEIGAVNGEAHPPALQATAAMEIIPLDLDLASTDDEALFDASLSEGESELDFGGDAGEWAVDVVAETESELAGEEPVIDLDSLVPVVAADDFEVPVGLADLEPDSGMGWAAEEPIIDLDSLSPITDEEDVWDVVDLADIEPASLMGLPTEEPIIDLDQLGSVFADEEDVVSLADLAPEPESGEAVMELADLAPEPDMVEPAMDLADLAPEAPEPEEDVVSLADLAPEAPEPEEDVVSLADLAPEAPEPEEDVVSLADLAPEAPEPEEDVVSLADLAPEAPDPEEDVVSLADLAPEASEPEEDLVLLADLAPEAPDGDEEVVALADLAPEPVMDLSDSAPTPEADEDTEVMDLGALAPDSAAEQDDDAVELAGLAPEAQEASEPEDASETTMMDLLDPAPEADDVIIDMDALKPPATEEDVGVTAEEAPDDEGPGEPVYTRTLGELYVKQGAIDQAIEVFRHLSSVNPGDAEISQRLGELESGAVLDHEDAGAEEQEPEVETLARELAEGGHAEHEVESPFAWTGETDAGAANTEAGPSIGDYLEGLLAWKPGGKP